MLNSYLHILFLFISLAVRVLKWKWIDTQGIIDYLNRELKPFQLQIEPALEKRIKLYVVMSSFTITWLCTLRGSAPSASEKKRATYLAALIPFLDDLSDANQMTSDEIRNYVLQENYEDGKMSLVKKIYQFLVEECGQGFIESLDAAALAQDESIKQRQEDPLTENELRTITYNKGSLSLLLYRKILSHPEEEGEHEAIAQLGYLLQYMNDMFDIFKDRNEKQQTLFTMYPHMQARRTEFENILHTFKSQILQLPFSKKNKLKCLSQLLTVTSRGEVMMNQLLACEKSTSGKFELHSYSRQQLVCDMEKWENIKSSYLYSVKAYEKLTS